MKLTSATVTALAATGVGSASNDSIRDDKAKEPDGVNGGSDQVEAAVPTDHVSEYDARTLDYDDGKIVTEWPDLVGGMNISTGGE